MTSAYRVTLATLLVCSWPTKCQRRSRSAQASALGAASWSRFSPKSRWPSSYSSRTSEAGQVLVTAISVISSRDRPAAVQAASIPCQTSARPSASSARRASEALLTGDRRSLELGHLRKSGTSRSSSSSKMTGRRRVVVGTSNVRPAGALAPFEPELPPLELGAPEVSAASDRRAAWSSASGLALSPAVASLVLSAAVAPATSAVSDGLLAASSLALTTGGAAGVAGSWSSITLPATTDLGAGGAASPWANHG